MFKSTIIIIIKNHSRHNIFKRNRSKLISFGMSKNIAISSSFFSHIKIDKRNKNQIDHVVVDEQLSTMKNTMM